MRFTYFLKKMLACGVFLAVCALAVAAQTNGSSSKTKMKPGAPTAAPSGSATVVSSPAKSTPAYAEVLLRKTEMEAALEDLLVDYTDEFAKVKETRYELNLIQKELDRLATTSDASKLSLALGRLIVRKATLDTDLWILLQKYGEAHDEVKRARRKAATFERAIKEILP